MDVFPDAPATDAQKGERIQMIDRLSARLAAIPGVRRVGAVGTLPLGAEAADGTFLLLGAGDRVDSYEAFGLLAKNPDRTGQASYCAADPAYFETMGIPLKAGRLFRESDVRSAPHVALISEALARRRFADSDPIGRRIEFGNMNAASGRSTSAAKESRNFALSRNRNPS